jgi:hypothetical protein
MAKVVMGVNQTRIEVKAQKFLFHAFIVKVVTADKKQSIFSD